MIKIVTKVQLINYLFSGNKTVNGQINRSFEHFQATKIALTRNVGQCPTWWPPCRI